MVLVEGVGTGIAAPCPPVVAVDSGKLVFPDSNLESERLLVLGGDVRP